MLTSVCSGCEPVVYVGSISSVLGGWLARLMVNVRWEREHENTANLSNEQNISKVSNFPEFYRGIYLTNPSGKKIEKLQGFINAARRSEINVFVIDVQPAPQSRCSIPREKALHMTTLLTA